MARESSIARSRAVLSWCDELTGVRFVCPRCARATAVMRRLRPVDCHPIYWLLCLSTVDRGCTVMSTEVMRELLGEALEPDAVSRFLGERPFPHP